MNCYCSNIIEGHNTLRIDIGRAMAGEYAQEPEKRNLQLEARTHIEVQQLIDSSEMPFPVLSLDGICWTHGEFCRRFSASPNRADRRTAAGIVLSGVVATPTKTYLDYSRITTANLAKGQSPVPRSLEEQIAWKEVLANPAGGTLLDLNSDVRFLKINGWQKMEYSTNTSRGAISIHYQYNTITGKPYDIKVVSKPLK